MIVGICAIELRIENAGSLKDKRRVLKSILDRIRNRFNVSIAEIDQQDLWQRSTLGLSAVSNNSTHVQQSLDAVIKMVESNPEVEVLHIDIELV